MIDHFYIVCKVSDEELGKIISTFRDKYLKDCEVLFEHNFKHLSEILQRPDARPQGTDAYDHFN